MNPNAWYLSLVLLFALVDLLVLLRVYVLLKNHPLRFYWRGMLAIWSIICIGFCIAWMWRLGLLGGTRDPAPRSLVAAQYIWHFLFLPVLVIGLLIDGAIRFARSGWKHLWLSDESPAPPTENPTAAAINRSRRQFLASAAFVAAPIATAGLAEAGMGQIGAFRQRFYDLSLAGWPQKLDGYTITVIADVHVGVFSTPKMLDDIVAAGNALDSDLVLLPGDLINVSHRDLPAALDMVLRLNSHDGVYLIEGNHDVVEGPGDFDDAVRRRGINLLVDQAATLSTRGASFQLLGTRWTSDQFRDDSVAYTASLRDPSLFAIMMAHHPHSWDMAMQYDIPLVISGHTHGGQIMLTRNIGLGRLRFHYLSGLYETENSKLIVSNGVGNWFPLRIGAPAEILQITLRSKT